MKSEQQYASPGLHFDPWRLYQTPDGRLVWVVRQDGDGKRAWYFTNTGEQLAPESVERVEIAEILSRHIKETKILSDITPEMLRQLRAERGWTQAQLAERLSIGQSFVAMVEAGQREMSNNLLWQLISILE